jgi:phenylalanyl-tRNA synthetase beta chain
LITFRLTSPAKEAKSLPKTDASGPDERPYVTITNPNSYDYSVMRHNLLSSVLDIAATNSRYQERIALFEIGPIFIEDEEEVLPTELTRLALTITGQRAPSSWQNNNDTAVADFFDLKGVLESLFRALHVDVAYEAAAHPSYRPGRTAKLLIGSEQIGVMGELHPLVVEQHDIRVEREQPVLAADIDLALLLKNIPTLYEFQPISPFPAVREDLAVVVDKEVTAVTVAETIRQAGGFLLKDVQLFDVFEGEQVGKGKKSLAYHLTYQAPDKTLNDKVVAKQRQKIIGTLKQQLNANIRD